MADQSHDGPALALVCDGVGYGDDGSIWGGELLWTDYRTCRRLASLTPLPLIGGDAAAHETSRCGLAMLGQLPELEGKLVDHPLTRSWWERRQDRQFLTEMLRRNLNCVATSAAGRWFDGVAALLGVCLYNSFESQAAQRLEALAATYERSCREDKILGPLTAEPAFRLKADAAHPALTRLDLAPLVRQLLDGLARGVPTEELAYGFHLKFADAWDTVIAQAVVQTGVSTIGLSGGVFCNELLTRLISQRLRSRGFRVLRHVDVAPNDSGLALGQAAVVMAQRSERKLQEAKIEGVFTCA
jgi:hydrogenase maturation protein HypF